MKPEVAILSDKMLEVLDSDITHLEMVLTALDELRGCVIKRDDEKMRQLLSIAQSELEAYHNIENQRAMLRDKIAFYLGIVPQELNLSRLKEYVDLEREEKITQKQNCLRELVARMKKEHGSTVLFMRECARFNNQLLHSLLGNRKQLTYNMRGNSRWHTTPGSVNMVNMKF